MNGPKIVALEHGVSGYPSATGNIDREKLLKVLNAIPVKPSIMFVEVDDGYVDMVRNRDPKFKHLALEPFTLAILWAEKNGLKIVPLNTKGDSEAISKLPKHSEDERFVVMNVREWKWPGIIRENNGGERDLIIMHPNHVEGFLKESGMQHEVIWISEPVCTLYRRLDPDEVVKLMQEKPQNRKKEHT